MIALIQRVSSASVQIGGEEAGAIGSGILLLLGVQRDDNEEKLQKLLNKVLSYRIFPDDSGRMNLSLTDINAELLVTRCK